MGKTAIMQKKLETSRPSMCHMQTTQEVADEAVHKQNATAARVLRYSNRGIFLY